MIFCMTCLWPCPCGWPCGHNWYGDGARGFHEAAGRHGATPEALGAAGKVRLVGRGEIVDAHRCWLCTVTINL